MAPNTAPPDKPGSRSFLDLPPELRVFICEYLFPKSSCKFAIIGGSIYEPKREENVHRLNDDLAICRTSHLIHKEALPILFERTSVRFQPLSLSRQERFRAQASSRQSIHISGLALHHMIFDCRIASSLWTKKRLEYRVEDMETLLRLLNNCAGARSLLLRFDRGMMTTNYFYVVRRPFEDLECDGSLVHVELDKGQGYDQADVDVRSL